MHFFALYPELTALAVATLYVLAILAVFKALRHARTSQGAVAWVVSLLTVPYLALPLYWVFGRNKFTGYYQQRKTLDRENASLIDRANSSLKDFFVSPKLKQQMYISLAKLARLPVTSGNQVQLLINGEATFNSIAGGMEQAQHFILFQFYILRDDSLGQRMGEILARKAQAGVKVFVLYDEVGTRGFHRTRLYQQLCSAGAQVAAFNTTQGPKNRLQLNFRNHRKTVVVDGHKAWIGGLNVGDEYLGKSRRFGHWRDTHTCVTGPAALGAQLAFATDWRWATRRPLGIDWDITPQLSGEHNAIVFASDPSSHYDEAGLMFHQAIVEAKERIWIASPYFVPDEVIVSALQLAALRGVDVRVIIPDNPDGPVVGLAAWSYTRQLIDTGVKLYRYQHGFMHQKVLLLDDYLAGVGTANFDNRSFRLNFEITLLVDSFEFAIQVHKMLAQDLSLSRRVTQEEIDSKPWWHHYATDAARLLSPVL